MMTVGNVVMASYNTSGHKTTKGSEMFSSRSQAPLARPGFTTTNVLFDNDKEGHVLKDLAGLGLTITFVSSNEPLASTARTSSGLM